MTNEEFEKIIDIVKAYDDTSITLETVVKITDGIVNALKKMRDGLVH